MAEELLPNPPSVFSDAPCDFPQILTTARTSPSAMPRSVFRPCIDLHGGRVKQIVGGTLSESSPSTLKTNFVARRVLYIATGASAQRPR